MMSRITWLALIFAATLAGCGGGGTAVVSAPPIAPPTPIPGASQIAYAVVESGSQTMPLTIVAYSTSGSQLFSVPELGGSSIEFDTSDLLWFDSGGEFEVYRPDGTVAVPYVFGGNGALATFDAADNLYTTGAVNVFVSSVGADHLPVLGRTLSAVAEPCWVAADAAGRVYVASCLAGPTPFQRTLGPVAMYAPGATTASVSDATATGPLAVDASGSLYAVVNGAVAVWSAGTFGSAAAARTLPPGPPGTIQSLAVDRAGTAYIIVRPTPTTRTTQSTLYAVASGATNPVILQTGFVFHVATPK
jgi:hypothetical protein